MKIESFIKSYAYQRNAASGNAPISRREMKNSEEDRKIVIDDTHHEHVAEIRIAHA
jgi:hypothetical protein